MIQLLAHRYRKSIAYCLSVIFLLSFSLPLYSMRSDDRNREAWWLERFRRTLWPENNTGNHKTGVKPLAAIADNKRAVFTRASPVATKKAAQKDIGGPTQPEMSSFKSIGSDNLVNLFTGDFSYNIPLLDVGGYPVNIFYNGGITMDQDASWVGLGWNINPGNVNRNMRGVPDDFNGTDILEQTQKTKPNNTWGITLSPDFEFVGIKDLLSISAGGSFGISFNNYLGPALDLGLKGGVSMQVASKVTTEKNGDKTDTSGMSLSVGAGLGGNLNSRYGLTFSPSVSLTASVFKNNRSFSNGLSLGTSYNSRNGIKALQITDQMSFNRSHTWKKEEGKKYRTLKEHGSTNSALMSTTISFAKPGYLPAIRMPLTNTAYSGHFQLGGGLWGIYVSGEVEVFRSVSEVADGDVLQKKPMVGYMYYEKGVNNPEAVMDFTRLNDNEVTRHTTIISAPQYTYDVFSIQGEGTGGTIRAYRNDYGYVRDNSTISRDNNMSFGADIGVPGHFGANFNMIRTPTFIGEWLLNNKLRSVIPFTGAAKDRENVYFRNPGETSVLTDQQYKKIGGTDLVRFRMGGANSSPSIEPILERFTRENAFIDTTRLYPVAPVERKKRSQVINFLTAEEASKVGLDKYIRSYNGSAILSGNNNLLYDSSQRVSGYRKPHHISQINVTETDGKRYVYGIPVYNTLQQDFTFTVSSNGIDDDLVTFQPGEPTPGSSLLSSGSKKNGFLQINKTPPYAHSYLLSGLLSADYVDVTGNGITEDDLGDGVKFNYTQIAAVHKWRTPLGNGMVANFNTGNRSDVKDNKGIISYGERESWYLHSVESKTMIALFTLESRADGKGAFNESKDINYNDGSIKRLKKIDLYNKADLKKNGLANAKPVKSVHFQYSYTLCPNTPGNKDSVELVNGVNVNAKRGKLTLDRIYFTFNGKSRAAKNQYIFSYGDDGRDNPQHNYFAADRWGNYKPDTLNPGGLKNSAYPYSKQTTNADTLKRIHQYAGAWSLKKILLPSGGQLEIEYESDDYAYVQNRRASAMMEIAGFGRQGSSVISNELYTVAWPDGVGENDLVYIKIPQPCASRTEVFQKYLQDVKQLAFKVAVVMPGGEYEYITSYGTVADYDRVSNNLIWVRLQPIDGMSPLLLTALEYLREQLPGQAFPGYDVSEGTSLQQVGDMLVGMLHALKTAFKDPIKDLRSRGLAKQVLLSKSFVRLPVADGIKYGGGHRVRSVRLKDNWNAMVGQDSAAVYGQVYNYKTTEVFNGTPRTISSGVASYEPGIGGEENPFQTIVQVANKLPAGPTTHGGIEMPVLDAFFPAPTVGYSKVTVTSLKRSSKKTRSGVGKQVTEFYTAKDFPVYYNHTGFDKNSDKQSHQNSSANFFYKYAFDSRALSQGFVVETNDMHGKLRSQSSYAENDSTSRISYTENFYRNTGSKGLNELFDFAYKGGEIRQGNMGIDIELMTDVREFSVKSTSLEIQAQLDLFPVILPFWLPFIWPVAGESENTYRAVTTTKVISYHSVLDSVLVIDKGSQVSTKNLVYDAETGAGIVTRTNNEYDKPVYNTSYPAWWAYSGMGPAYKNIDAVYTSIGFHDGKIISGMTNDEVKNIFESGDELYLLYAGDPPSDNCGAKLVSPNAFLLWAFDKNKNNSSLTNRTPDFVFMDSSGRLYTKSNVSFRIIRSGKRNILGASVGNVSSLTDPVTATNPRKIVFNSSSKVVNATSAAFKEKWQADIDAIGRFKTVFDPATCSFKEQIDCNGYLDQKINPYKKKLLGSFIAHRSMVFYGNRAETDPLATTNLPQNGFLSNFKLYWDFNVAGDLVPDMASTQWVWNNEVTRLNAKGRELETKNALNIYTAAQYGFNKSLPVAIANNARYDEMFFEGFEDFDYLESISYQPNNPCSDKHIDFNGIPNSTIVKTDTTPIRAHSGKYILQVNENRTLSKSLPVKSTIDTEFPLEFKKDTTKSLVVIGMNIDRVQKTPAALILDTSVYPNEANANEAMFLRVRQSNANRTSSSVSYAYDIDASNYIEVLQDRVYDITTKIMEYRQTSSTFAGMPFTITSLDGVYIPITYISSGFDTKLYRACLTKGIYKLSYFIHADYYYSCTGSGCTWELPGVEYSLTFDDHKPGYQSPTTQNGCIFTKPLAATSSMLHPAFSIPANKRMLFSTWVKDSCFNPTTGEPCNSVVLQFNDGSNTTKTFRPSGPVIDGWQRIEGDFLVPATATSMEMKLINNSSKKIYYDDIRIHPFNANMQSYVYDPVNLRLVAQLDANNYGTFYEYNEEGSLVRTKAETKDGIKTISEMRSGKQKTITNFK